MVGVMAQVIDLQIQMTPMTPMTPFLYRWDKYKIREKAHTRKTPAYMEIAVTSVTGVMVLREKSYQSNTCWNDTYFEGVMAIDGII
jgi:hypothetical protein